MFDHSTQATLKEHIASLPLLIGEASLRHDVDDLIAQIFPSMKLCVVDDKNTSEAFGSHVAKALGCPHLTLEQHIKADDAVVQYIREASAGSDALVAVGSGTVSDLCKYASHLDKKPYAVFPTAASMNGYSSANASITFDGYKKTVAAQLPQAVFCDFSVIANAPVRLSKSGLGDALARPTAQADWLLSHLVLGTHYNNIPFSLIAPFEPELFESARGIGTSDPRSIELLIKISLLSGFGMTIAGGSYPASQGEHMIAHAYGMLHGSPCLHGEEIGVTTLTMAKLQQHILRSGGHIRANDFDAGKIRALFGATIAAEAEKAFQEKMNSCKGANLNWDNIREHISPITLAPEKLEAILAAAKAPTRPEMLGWTPEHYTTITTCARYVRERFTFLDINPG